jgi:hypothetical protein
VFTVKVVVQPVTVKLPVIATSPDIVPPVDENLLFAAAKAPLAYAPALTALPSAVDALVSAVLALVKAPLA